MALIVQIKVVPSSGQSRWIIDKSGILKGYLKNPAERGLANEELVKTIAKALRITQNHITIVSGATDRNKRIKIDTNITYEQLLAALGIERQLTVF